MSPGRIKLPNSLHKSSTVLDRFRSSLQHHLQAYEQQCCCHHMYVLLTMLLWVSMSLWTLDFNHLNFRTCFPLRLLPQKFSEAKIHTGVARGITERLDIDDHRDLFEKPFGLHACCMRPSFAFSTPAFSASPDILAKSTAHNMRRAVPRAFFVLHMRCDVKKSIT